MTAGRSPVELLDTLDALRAKATPGVWEVCPYWFERAHVAEVTAGDARITTDLIDAADAACIVAEHNASPALVAALRAVLGLAEELEDEAQRQVDDTDSLASVVGRSWVNAARQFRAAVAAALAPEGGQAE